MARGGGGALGRAVRVQQAADSAVTGVSSHADEGAIAAHPGRCAEVDAWIVSRGAPVEVGRRTVEAANATDAARRRVEVKVRTAYMVRIGRRVEELSEIDVGVAAAPGVPAPPDGDGSFLRVMLLGVRGRLIDPVVMSCCCCCCGASGILGLGDGASTLNDAGDTGRPL